MHFTVKCFFSGLGGLHVSMIGRKDDTTFAAVVDLACVFDSLKVVYLE